MGKYRSEKPPSKPRADIRIRIRGRIIRVHVSETVIRAIIRIATDLRTVRDKPVYQ